MSSAAFALLACYFVPRGVSANDTATSPRDLLRAVRGNRLFWRYCAILGLWQLGNGIFSSVFFIFITQYFKLGPQFAPIMLVYFAVQVASLPLWLKLIRRFGKHRPGAWSWILNALVPFVVLLFEPGPAAFVPALVLTAVMGLVAAGGQVVPLALLGDIVDYDILRTGVNRAGNYFALQNVLFKLCMGAGMGIGLPLIAAFGYAHGCADRGAREAGAGARLPGPARGLPARGGGRRLELPAGCPAARNPRRRIAQRAERARAAAVGTAGS